MTAGNHLRVPRPEPTGPMAAFPADATGSRPQSARWRPIQPTWTLPMPNPSEPGVTVAPTASGQPATMRRAVGRWQLFGLSINDVIGSGIYLLPAAAALLLGPASLWAVLLAGLAVSLLVLCYARSEEHTSKLQSLM